MPSSDSILTALTAVANGWRWLAVIWHAVLFGLVLTLLAGWRPSSRFLGTLLMTPVLSVSVLAWSSGNPFNGLLFAVLAVLLASAAIRFREAVLEPARRWLVPGAALVAFGSTYPHFLTTESLIAYIYAAPFGLLPCPTLSVVIGITLMFGNFRSTAWTMPLIGAGLLYGVIGVFRLGVVLDGGLLAGATMLAAASRKPRRRFLTEADTRADSHRIPGGRTRPDSPSRFCEGFRAGGAAPQPQATRRRRVRMRPEFRRKIMAQGESLLVEGHVRREFENVRQVFADNFGRRRELGGACAACYRGEMVVDVWGGVRNMQTGEPWERDTMVIVYSATKGLAAMTLAIAHSRGWLDYEERVGTYCAGVRARCGASRRAVFDYHSPVGDARTMGRIGTDLGVRGEVEISG